MPNPISLPPVHSANSNLSLLSLDPTAQVQVTRPQRHREPSLAKPLGSLNSSGRSSPSEGSTAPQSARLPVLTSPAPSRTENDSLGTLEIPSQAYYGIHTQRAVDNFPITGKTASGEMIYALAHVKKAAALANAELGVIADVQANAIARACDLLLAGHYHEQFPVDVLQGGAGTSSNMNANEVITNLALQIMGKKPGEYVFLHPNDVTNASQSTNDVYPTAVKLATYVECAQLRDAVDHLREAFVAKAQEFADVAMIGRTQLQDAVPTTFKRKFDAYAVTLAGAEQRLAAVQEPMTVINMGGTAIGTGINAPQGYREAVTTALAQSSGVPVVSAQDLVEATQNTIGFVQVSGAVNELAAVLTKMADDLRKMASGPQAGLGDIQLPAQQAGSSIMPGKVNPVIPEMMNQVAMEAMGNHLIITNASSKGELELNAFEPLMQNKLHESLTHMTNACEVLADRCISGITVDREKLDLRVASSATVATALNRVIGYQNAAAIAKEAVKTGGLVADLAGKMFPALKDKVVAVLGNLSGIMGPYQVSQPTHGPEML
jgi:aspartate ammonia-lyase